MLVAVDTDNTEFINHVEQEILAKTIWGEARGKSTELKEAAELLPQTPEKPDS